MLRMDYPVLVPHEVTLLEVIVGTPALILEDHTAETQVVNTGTLYYSLVTSICSLSESLTFSQ
jgi:hypothetical protein